jgi:hypothetical protein
MIADTISLLEPNDNLIECQECFAISRVDLRLGRNAQSFNGGIIFTCPCCGTPRRYDNVDYFSTKLHPVPKSYGKMTEAPLLGYRLLSFLDKEDFQIFMDKKFDGKW